MSSMREKEALANSPAAELQHSLTAFVAPVLTHLPEQRLRQVSLLAVRGILLAAQSPVLTKMARGGQPEDGLNWPLAKRFYRFVANPPLRSSHVAQRVVRCGAAGCRPLSATVPGGGD